MISNMNIEEIEKKVFTSTFKDGLMDLLLGVVLLQFAFAPLLTDYGFSDYMASAVFIPVYIIAFTSFYLLKKYVIKPRMGLMKPSPARRSKLIKVNLILFIILFIGLVTGFLFFNHTIRINILAPLLFSIIILLIAFTAGYFLNIYRLYIYGLVMAIALMIGELLWRKGLVSHHGFPVMFGTLSFMLILVGIIHLIIFLKNNPVSGETTDDI